MALKHGPELRNTAVAVLLAAPTYPEWVPVEVKAMLMIVALTLLLWTWAPRRIGRVQMTFGLTLAVVSAIGVAGGVLIHFAAPNFLAATAAPASPPAPAVSSTEQQAGQTGQSITNNGPVYNAPVTINQAPKPQSHLQQDRSTFRAKIDGSQNLFILTSGQNIDMDMGKTAEGNTVRVDKPPPPPKPWSGASNLSRMKNNELKAASLVFADELEGFERNFMSEDSKRSEMPPNFMGMTADERQEFNKQRLVVSLRERNSYQQKFKTDYWMKAVAFRNELQRRLGLVGEDPGPMVRTIFVDGMLTGPYPLAQTAGYLRDRAERLPPN